MTTQPGRVAEQDFDTSPWWRQRYCWLVISGPLVVVIAALSTMVIAYRGADPVVQEYLSQHLPKGLDQRVAVSMRPAEMGAAMVRPVGVKPVN
ncbi:MAG: hypothetical protein JWM03_1789 [Rhodocyclales bacterium]|nr:hypothetical protein [Rhodocyclales bacterium]